jgi:tRNA:m4X modification enzyme
LSNHKFKALLLAICCHHRCEWSTFCGKDFFKEININREWFYRVRSLTSWATCGQRVKDDGNDELKQKRDKIGRIAKNLIDSARIKYLNKTGMYETRLLTYCDELVTLENRLLIVLPKEK